ncbi:MAG: NAD-dependent epimerase/dehydratase family protein [Rhodospirillales bacterium]
MQRLANKDDLILVTGAGGFIGGHLIGKLHALGFRRLRGVDIKPVESWFQRHPAVDERQLDLRTQDACRAACEGAAYVFNLAADMGGIGYIEQHKTACMLSVLINTHMLLAARDQKVKRYLYSSSACVYPQDKQTDPDNPGLREDDAYPAMAEDGYGWEKLFSERMCRHFTEDYGLATRVIRYHNVYGPHGYYEGGREKAPAAICRKVIDAWRAERPQIEIWGDGEQTRSFMYVDDCIRGTLMIMESDIGEPINLGSTQLVTINQLVDLVEGIAGVTLERRYNLDAPKGVRGRNSDNTLIEARLGWAPSTRLEAGMPPLFHWIKDQMLGRRATTRPRIRVSGDHR